MPLSSPLFTKEGAGKQRLEDCASLPDANFYAGKPPTRPGTEDAVRRIQTALQTLGFKLAVDGVYGSETANAVFAFKNSRSPKILGPGQTIPDKVVGIGTITALDKAMGGSPSPPGPPPQPPSPRPRRRLGPCRRPSLCRRPSPGPRRSLRLNRQSPGISSSASSQMNLAWPVTR
ncbi:peptidoglycan-binding domain-containing protein [Bradyrhizobium prioriisuperbiae]|uniref:peptidoglycan-binding domain-containing protein n=1 Tax=Bradyrhizobium prioriisuperbiae TaxID=2854389 RepID=UPI0028EA2A3D|nr:peptidoglycan-binding protein [Bradyrhizobium prioritasuperba]